MAFLRRWFSPGCRVVRLVLLPDLRLVGAGPAWEASRELFLRRWGFPISARVRAPVRGPNPVSVLSTCPRG